MRSLAKLILRPKILWFVLLQAFKVRFWLRFDLASLNRDGFFTWHRRPKSLSNWRKPSHDRNLSSKVGIVIQGPIVHKFSFTLESVRLYRFFNPNAEIVVSTWEGVENRFLQECQMLGVHVVQNKVLAAPHYGNLNRQQVTSLGGLLKLRQLGIEYAVKTRSDQRVYNPNFIEELLVAEKFFPALKYESSSNKSRIFLTYQNSFRERYLSGSDFLQFGHTKELIELWESIDAMLMPVDLAAEQILIGNYLLKLGAQREGLVSENSWIDAIGRVFGFIDPTALDLFWLKYSSREYLWRRYGEQPLQEISSADWYSAILKIGGFSQ